MALKARRLFCFWAVSELAERSSLSEPTITHAGKNGAKACRGERVYAVGGIVFLVFDS
jgi:hypothetical protein